MAVMMTTDWPCPLGSDFLMKHEFSAVCISSVESGTITTLRVLGLPACDVSCLYLSVEAFLTLTLLFSHFFNMSLKLEARQPSCLSHCAIPQVILLLCSFL